MFQDLKYRVCDILIETGDSELIDGIAAVFYNVVDSDKRNNRSAGNRRLTQSAIRFA